ncbi:TonB-dependent receptor [Lewinellaceae bacterium SD302]|nr:TonB-dependent receptor [Lewinellaceae bacterium SD302]
MHKSLLLAIGIATLLAITPDALRAQKKLTLSGYVSEAGGETLIGANVYVQDQPVKGAATNAYGFYSLSLEPGEYTIVYSYLGYADRKERVNLAKEDVLLSVDLSQGATLEEVVVTAEEEDENISETQMGTVELTTDKVKKLPAIFGEVDVLKTLQLLPGVQSGGEGSSGFYVRGGGPDQNLVLLDEAVVYNSGHLLGFFSVFNPDAIKNTTLIKGGMPANYGGRLSSVVDIQMKEGNDESFRVDGGIGLVASRLTLQGPIQKEKSSFILSGRRTYILDLAQPAIDGTDFAGTNYYFYDFNAKANYRFSEKDRLYLSGYFGRDVLKFQQAESDFNFDLPYGNTTGTLRWNHLFNNRLFFNLSAVYNEYDFGFEGGQGDFSVNVFSGVRDYNLKLDFDFFPVPEHSLKYGLAYTYHRLTPQVAEARSGDEVFTNGLESRFANEFGAYVLDDWKISPRLAVNYGIRFSSFTQLGPYVSSFDGTEYDRDEAVKTYSNLEPRLGLRYHLNSKSSLKAGVTRTAQYLHLVSNSTSTLPTDIWVPSSELVKPQLGLQYALGYFRNFNDNAWEASVEVYYKDLKNQIDYRESYVNNPADDIEQQFVFGQGRAYGAEFFINKRKGRLTGWLGYTISRTERTFPDINDGKTYRAVYDRPHDLSLVTSYEFSKKVTGSAVFVYGSGQTFTPLRSLYLIEGGLVQEYAPRNSSRIQDYHRLDLSVIWTPKPDSEKRFKSSWAFSVYNGYNRQNPFFIYYDLDVNRNAGTAEARALQVSLFPVIPSVTWNFSWQ